jgi:hypothetical protein
MSDDEEIEDERITQSFVPSRTSTCREDKAINDSLKRVQNNRPYVLWPEIEGILINEFQTVGYMARAFLTLYPYGHGDL